MIEILSVCYSAKLKEVFKKILIPRKVLYRSSHWIRFDTEAVLVINTF